MQKKLASILIASMLATAACSTPKLLDPTVEYPTPPAELMTPTQNMETIPLDSK